MLGRVVFVNLSTYFLGPPRSGAAVGMVAGLAEDLMGSRGHSQKCYHLLLLSASAHSGAPRLEAWPRASPAWGLFVLGQAGPWARVSLGEAVLHPPRRAAPMRPPPGGHAQRRCPIPAAHTHPSFLRKTCGLIRPPGSGFQTTPAPGPPRGGGSRAPRSPARSSSSSSRGLGNWALALPDPSQNTEAHAWPQRWSLSVLAGSGGSEAGLVRPGGMAAPPGSPQAGAFQGKGPEFLQPPPLAFPRPAPLLGVWG